ncbi:ETC complex I subunit [Novosphingopyxis sp.]|uniref:ETC complex I subunit n=1 Tax=Novosphingopyxis sp. TaxID=2709690 RepID=UPI003B59CFE0
MTARIYQRPQSAMTSGRALTDRWILEYDPAEAKRPDPLTGWAGSGDTRQQLQLKFGSCEAAKAYAERNAIEYAIVPTPTRTLKIQAYADNFR